MEIKLKRVQFNVDLAKKITKGKINGAKITTRLNRKSRIIAFDVKGDYPIAVAITQVFPPTREIIHLFNNNGVSNSAEDELYLYVPVYYNNYSNFTPQKWQPCLVRNLNFPWIIRVATGKYTENKEPYFFNSLPKQNDKERYDHYLPLSKLTLKLLGTIKSYEELFL